MKRRTFLQSLNNAVEGFIYVVKSERNMRVHFLFGFLILLFGVVIGVSRVEWMILCTIVTLVWVAEMINTAIEETLDMLAKSFHSSVRIIKDISAAVVMISALNALIVGFFIFSKYISWPLELAVMKVRYAPWTITFIALLVVSFLVIAAKAFFHSGTPFRGGLVSGHAAAAFSLWTTIFLTNQNLFIVGVTFLLAALVAQSRLRAKIHSIWEVLAGGVLGFLVTALFFQLFR